MLLTAVMWVVGLAATTHILCALAIVYLYHKEVSHAANRNVPGVVRRSGRKPKARPAPTDPHFPTTPPAPLWDNSLHDSSGATRRDA